ncbi:transposase [Candidatus Entotheonella palauensis]|uniref:transposase n=1 Tax=Candidatus Entotheonella palauensis TaxID=93172 RepID=UPI000B7E7969|nr:transposase [Candidatus Entotheonella palauensis]
MNIYTPSQIELYNDPWAFLEPTRRRLLEQSWAGVFRYHVWPHLPVEALTACFTKTGGRPRKSPRLMLGTLILQQLHDVTDTQAVDALAFNLSWHFALDIPPYCEVYICERTLRNYRQVVRDNGLAEFLFQHLTDVLIQDFHIDTTQQRIDSTAIRSAIRKLSRLGIVVETVSKFVRELARIEPDLYARVNSEIVRLYVDRQGEGCFDWGKAGESKRRLPEALSALWGLVQQFDQTAASHLPSYQILSRVLLEQSEVQMEPQGQSMVSAKVPADIPSDSVPRAASASASSKLTL